MLPPAFAFLTILLSAALGIGIAADGDLFNGEFEIADLNRATIASQTPPADWMFRDVPFDEREFFTNTNTINLAEFFYNPEPGFTDILWIDKAQNGKYFVLLSTGITWDDRDNHHSTISQIITLNPGDVVSGYYFFGTRDYVPFNDTAFGKLIDPTFTYVNRPSLDLSTDENGDFTPYALASIPPNDIIHPNNGIELFRINVKDVGSYMSTNGWMQFYYRYTGSTSRPFRLVFQVRDGSDKFLSSYLALDNIRICRNVPAVGDINKDCVVNLLDLMQVAQWWLADCQQHLDPNNQPQPACLAADMNGDKAVGAYELSMLGENWLGGDSRPCATDEFDSGDLNFDCKVDFEDYLFLAKSWLKNCVGISDPALSPYNPYCALADINKDNVVNAADMLLQADQWLNLNGSVNGATPPDTNPPPDGE